MFYLISKEVAFFQNDGLICLEDKAKSSNRRLQGREVTLGSIYPFIGANGRKKMMVWIQTNLASFLNGKTDKLQENRS